MQLTVLDQFTSELETVAEKSPQATFYHARLWTECLSRVFSYMSYRCIVAEEGGRVLGYLPYFIISKGPVRIHWSMPFGTYGGPVALESNDLYHPLLKKFTQLGKQMWVYETVFVDYSNRIPGRPYKTGEHLTHLIDLSGGFDEIWSKSFDKSKRKQAKRAERKGVKVIESTSLGEAARFYDIYASRVRAYRGKIHYPQRLFIELVKNSGQHVKLFLSYHENQLLGGQLCFYYKDMVIAWYGSTTMESRDLQASTGLYAHCIRHACENGYKWFNLGGSIGKDSLMDYKMSFGGHPHQYNMSVRRSPFGKVAAVLKKFKD
jgi:lipid II:glycine glycyltransferase (peptidoglycan interpeptide bridge formation enzyme)